MNNIKITMTGSQPPPPGSAPPPTTTATVRRLPGGVDLHKALSIGNLICGIALIVTNILSLVGNTLTLQLLNVVVLVFLIGGGGLIATAALVMLPQFVRYVGFIQFPFGSGFLLTLLGILAYGSGGTGNIMGACTIGMGVIDMLAHMYLRGKNAAVHITLLRR